MTADGGGRERRGNIGWVQIEEKEFEEGGRPYVNKALSLVLRRKE